MSDIFYFCFFLQGRRNIQPFCPPKPNDTATICYTSGTTGTPKVDPESKALSAVSMLWMILCKFNMSFFVIHGKGCCLVTWKSDCKCCRHDSYHQVLSLRHVSFVCRLWSITLLAMYSTNILSFILISTVIYLTFPWHTSMSEPTKLCHCIMVSQLASIWGYVCTIFMFNYIHLIMLKGLFAYRFFFVVWLAMPIAEWEVLNPFPQLLILKKKKRIEKKNHRW